MSAAISQKSRPIHWDQVVGQEHVKDVLRPALERGRIGHAYLFSGPRGVGKTTTARLIAMTVNCDDATAVKPCGVCESCRMVIAGRHPDVLEIDAASNNSVEDVRDLREKVALQPMRGSNKVYILDEAHMMSKSAFNALLKTLEEPPAHAVFILATTEPERLPPTILSRCQHYRFRRLSVGEIAGKLDAITIREGVNADKRALDLIARASDGAMRDGESLLERLLASGEPALTLSQAESALGLPPQERIRTLAISLGRGQAGAMLEALGHLYADGFAPRTVTERVKIELRDMLHQQLGVGGLRIDQDGIDQIVLLKLIRALDEEDQRFARASDLIALEMAFTKALMAMQSAESSTGAAATSNTGTADAGLLARINALERTVRDGGIGAAKPAAASSTPDFDPMARVARPSRQPDAIRESTLPQTQNTPSRTVLNQASNTSATWGDVVLKAKAQLKAFLREGHGVIQNDTVIVTYSEKHKWHADQVANKLGDVHILVKEVCGDHFSLELVMPDGSKKNSRGSPSSNPAGVNTVPDQERLSQPTRISNVLGTTPVSSTTASSEDEFLIQESPPIQRVPSALVQGGKIEIEPVEFEQLGVPTPFEKNLFAEQSAPATEFKEPYFEGTEVQLERSPLEPIPAKLTEPADEELPWRTPQKQKKSSSTVSFDLPISTLQPINEPGLEVTDLSTLEDAPPLEAFDMDELGHEPINPEKAAKAKVSAALQGHPTYERLSQLFTHTLREVGVIEAKVVTISNANTNTINTEKSSQEFIDAQEEIATREADTP